MGQLVFQATLGGQVNLVGPNTASTFNINVPATTGTMVTTGDSGTVTSTMLATSVYTAPGTIGSGTANTGAFTSLSYTTTLTGGTGIIAIGTNQIYKDASGNVGIGTSSPTVKFQVSGGIAIQGAGFPTAGAGIELSYNSGTSLASLQTYDRTGSAWKDLEINTLTSRFGTSGTERMRIDSSGNVGIGLTPTTYKFEITGGDVRTNTSSFLYANTLRLRGSDAYQIYENAASTNLQIGTASGAMIFAPSTIERMRIDTSGNVGIGTSSPTAVLMLKAGTATASTAPLKFTSGTNLTATEAGVVEYDGTVVTSTSNTNFGRATIPLTNYASGTGTALGTNTEATNAVLLPAANDTITLSIGTYFLDMSFIITRGATSTTSATARLNIRGTGGAVGTFSGMSLSAPTAGGATANFAFDAVNITTDNVLTAASTTAAGVYTMTVQGLLKVTTAGTIIPQYSLSANINAAGTVSKVLYLRLQQVDSQSAAAAGPAGTGWA